MKRDIMFSFILLILTFSLSAMYKIELLYDTFEGECSGFLSGTIGTNFGFTPGSKEHSLNSKLYTKKGSANFGKKKTYFINSEVGHFAFWIRDQFGDQDFEKDYELITKVKPQITIYKDNTLLKSISILPEDGFGLTCKVFELYAETGDIVVEKRFYQKTRIIIGKVVNALDGKPLSDVIVNNAKLNETLNTDEYGVFMFDIPFGEFGKHQIELAKTGFISGNVDVDFLIDENPREIIYALSPQIDKYRIVLTWGSRP
ncbi:MAG: hypothetical protein U9N34_03415, partial [Candidatus Cloacimonadota bacterium]|nr:hypothetical protein [Candidatus Cloacimonadota bacterium]